MSTHFKIIIPMYNCSPFATMCLASVRTQDYNNWQAIVIVEPCDDNTYEIVSSYIAWTNDPRFTLIKNGIRKNVPKNHIDGVTLSNPSNDDVIVLLDGDDSFYSTDVLSYLDKVYSNPDIWITWGSYTQRGGNGSPGGASIPQPSPENDPHKGQRWWRYSHLKTFRYKLFKHIKDEDLREKDTGNYYTVAGDMALMFPMVEMAGPKHSMFIKKILYEYNQSTPYNDEKIHYEHVKKCDTEIRNRPKYPLLPESEI